MGVIQDDLPLPLFHRPTAAVSFERRRYQARRDRVGLRRGLTTASSSSSDSIRHRLSRPCFYSVCFLAEREEEALFLKRRGKAPDLFVFLFPRPSPRFQLRCGERKAEEEVGGKKEASSKNGNRQFRGDPQLPSSEILRVLAARTKCLPQSAAPLPRRPPRHR